MAFAFLILTTIATSLISGVLSMAGGMILMGVFAFFLSVPAAMVLHGVAQAVSNGSRVWLHREHLRWNVLLPYSIGSFCILGIFVFITLVPDKGFMFMLIGCFPFIALLLPKQINLDMEHKPVAFLSGLVVTLAQMLAGASGPVLDIFYVKSSLNRYEILGTKAITQTLGHCIKLVYYAFFLTASIELPWWIYPGIVFAAIFGNWMAKQIIKRMHDDQFKKIGRYAIMIVGLVYIGKGLTEMGLIG